MSKYEKVKYYYESGLWDKERVNKAVSMHWITEEEYELIVGEPYVPINN